MGWDVDQKAQNERLAIEFADWLKTHRNEIAALQIFYHQPYRRREITFAMLKEVLDILKTEKPALAPFRVWNAYEQLDADTKGKRLPGPKAELLALVALIRRASGMDESLTPFDKTVDRNFQQWILRKNAGQHKRFTDTQMEGLRMVKDHIASSFHVEKDDFELDPFNAKGGLGKMWQLFGEEMEEILFEMNEALTA